MENKMEQNAIVFIKSSKLYLDTSMTQSSFSKSRITERLGETGFTAKRNGSKWEFSPWRFTGTLLSSTIKDGEASEHSVVDTVLLEGEGFDGKTLASFFDESPTSSAQAAAAVCAVIEQAIDANIKIANNGAGGIFISSDYNTIILLPQDLFETAVTCRGDTTYSENDGMYVYRSLTGSAALRFTQAVIAYRALTGVLPFADKTTAKRHEDYVDHNYVHLADMVYGLDTGLSFFVDNALMRNPKIESHNATQKQKKQTLNEKITAGIKEGVINERNAHEEKLIQRAGMQFPLTTFYRELGLTQTGAVPESGVRTTVIRSARISQEQFTTEAKKTTQSFNKSLQTKRWFRHHKTPLTVVSCIILGIAFFAFTYWHDNQKNPTTKGLTSPQTVEMFFSALNNLDVVAAQNSSTGKDLGNTVDIITNFYVSTKSRSAYEQKVQCVTPAAWLCYNNSGNYTMFGLTQFTIDGVQGKLDFTGPAKNTHPVALSAENGTALTPEAKMTHTVHYYLVYTAADETHVIEHNDTVTLTWKKNRWLITALVQNENDTVISTLAFTKSYLDAADSFGKDFVQIAQSLAPSYPWISTKDEIIEAKEKIIAENPY